MSNATKSCLLGPKGKGRLMKLVVCEVSEDLGCFRNLIRCKTENEGNKAMHLEILCLYAKALFTSGLVHKNTQKINA